MRCEICDQEDDAIMFDYERHEFCPCKFCEFVIQDALADFEEEEEPES